MFQEKLVGIEKKLSKRWLGLNTQHMQNWLTAHTYLGNNIKVRRVGIDMTMLLSEMHDNKSPTNVSVAARVVMNGEFIQNNLTKIKKRNRQRHLGNFTPGNNLKKHKAHR